MNQGYRWVDMEYQRHWLNPLLSVICRVMRWNYFWFLTDRRHLFIGGTDAPDRWQVVL